MKMKKQVSIFLFFSGFFLLPGYSNGQAEKKDLKENDLFREILLMDSVVFQAFNNRDMDQFKKLFTEDLEFYHDKGGLTGYDQTIQFLKSNTENNNRLKRQLVKESLEVYPIPGYGAMEIGQHTFCHLENGKQDCGTFKFLHIWKKINSEWKITRVISYNH
jgi:hypothetical protein